MKRNLIFWFLNIFIISIFGIFAYDPADIVILGPKFEQEKYFIQELDQIANELNIKIKYESVSDPETTLIKSDNNIYSIALIPNPQGVVNLANRNIIYDLDNLTIDNIPIKEMYPKHLNQIVSYEEKIYGGWLRLFPNSLIWYDVSKLNSHPDINLDNFDELIQYTNKLADNSISSWCLHSESGASSGWIQTNWLEDILLTKYGTKVYDKWSKLEISASSIEVFQSVSLIGEIVFYPNHLQGGYRSVNDKEFSTLPLFLLNDNNDCFLSWGGHYFSNYIPDSYIYEKDYGVVKFPKITYENSIVGVGDNIVLIKNNQLAQEVITRILSKEFGEIWSSHDDSQFISVNPSFDSRKIKNKLTLYEFEIIHDALKEDLFRYDASALMDRPIGADKLLKFFVEYLYSGKDSLVSLLNNLDKEY